MKSAVLKQVKKELKSQLKGKFTAKQIDAVKITDSDIREASNQICYGCHDAGWVSFYDFFLNEIKLDIDCIRGLIECAKEIGWWWPLRDYCIITNRPSKITFDVDGNLHNEFGKAIEYRDDWGLYAWHGVRIPEWIIEEKEKITPDKIDKERNVEIRRAMVEIIGAENYLKAGDAQLLDESDVGKLYRRSMSAPEEDIVMVEVVNSSPEPDGTFKHYWLRVPPNTRTAKEAVAWTFDKSQESYRPAIET